jgi:hypothetical protein
MEEKWTTRDLSLYELAPGQAVCEIEAITDAWIKCETPCSYLPSIEPKFLMCPPPDDCLGPCDYANAICGTFCLTCVFPGDTTTTRQARLNEARRDETRHDKTVCVLCAACKRKIISIDFFMATGCSCKALVPEVKPNWLIMAVSFLAQSCKTQSVVLSCVVLCVLLCFVGFLRFTNGPCCVDVSHPNRIQWSQLLWVRSSDFGGTIFSVTKRRHTMSTISCSTYS